MISDLGEISHVRSRQRKLKKKKERKKKKGFPPQKWNDKQVVVQLVI